MTEFSASEAIGSGFRTMQRRPAAILAWAAAYFVGGVLPQGLLWAKLAPLMAARPVDPQAMAAAMSGMGAWAPLMWLVGIVVSSVLYGAAFRAVLTPDDDRFLYLRLSRRELWLGLTMLAIVILFLVGSLITAVVIGLVGRNLPGVVVFLLALACIGGFIWLAMRFSLATVMAFAQSRFVFSQTWSLTAGHALKLSGVALAVLCIMIGIEMAVILPIGLALGFSGALRGLSAGAPPQPGQMLPWIAVFCIGVSLFGAVIIAVAGSPWASIYRQLVGADEAAA